MRAWNYFGFEAINFMGKKLTNSTSLWRIFCCPSEIQKGPFLNYHQDIFSIKCGALNVKHGECFHQDISAMEQTNQGKSSSPKFADYCWTVT
jgi:hypothetical protein